MAFRDFLLSGLKGFAMGASDIVPGVSGGTMALILGIYERLLGALKSFDVSALRLLKERKWKALSAHLELPFLVCVGFGMVVAIVGLSRPLTWLLHYYPTYVWAFFFGLVLASVLLLRNRVKSYSVFTAILCVAGFLIGFWMTGLVPAQTAQTPVLFFLSGAIAICAMMLPGISGSFLLVILGKYEQVLSAVKSGDILTLLPFILGIVIGLLAFAKVLSWLLQHHHDPMLLLLIGLMLGSLRKIWPWQTALTADQHILIIVCIGVGMLVVLGLHRLGSRKIM